jgi:hypothetical protein
MKEGDRVAHRFAKSTNLFTQRGTVAKLFTHDNGLPYAIVRWDQRAGSASHPITALIRWPSTAAEIVAFLEED